MRSYSIVKAKEVELSQTWFRVFGTLTQFRGARSKYHKSKARTQAKKSKSLTQMKP